MKRYRNKPYEVEAVKWTGDNAFEIEKFAGKRITIRTYVGQKLASMVIDVTYGQQELEVGDYVVRADDGKFYVWRQQYFEEAFEEIDRTRENIKGEWQIVSIGCDTNGIRCTACKQITVVPADRTRKLNFCPECGADMREVKE
jgi:hypothetical protein